MAREIFELIKINFFILRLQVLRCQNSVSVRSASLINA